MSRQDDRLQAQLWLDEPGRLSELLVRLADQLEAAVVPMPATNRRSEPSVTLSQATAASLVAIVGTERGGINEYRRLTDASPLDCRLVLDVLDRLQAESEDGQLVLPAAVLSEFRGNVDEFARWSRFQQRQEQTLPRSEALKTSIEFVDDELLVKTDGDGSLKLRGAVSIPMFLALWRAPGHRLSAQSFLDIDRSLSASGLERHSTRLCSKLQGVLLEVIRSGSGYLLRRCPRQGH